MSVIKSIKIQSQTGADIVADIGASAENIVFANNQTLDQIAVTFSGAGVSDAGSQGLVPAPAAGDQGKFLKGDGTWSSSSVDEQDIANVIDEAVQPISDSSINSLFN